MKPKLIRITTVPQSLGGLLKDQLKFMNNYYEVIGISSPGEKLDAVTNNEGVVTIPVEMTRTISPLKDLKSVYKLYKIFKKENPLIVHTHTPKAGTVGMLAAWLAGVPNRLHTVAGLPLLESKGNKRKLLDFVEKITYACANKVYPNSNGLKDIISALKFCSQGKLKVIGNGSSNGIDTDHFDPALFSDEDKSVLKQRLNIKDEDFVFIFVGRLVGDKGINELMQTFSKISVGNSNAKLLLVGIQEPQLDPLSKKTLDIINSNDNIICVGFQKDVRPYFAISNALVFPSYREGFPNVVMQAGAMGLPSIVTNINGCNEIVVEGVNGTIVLPKDIDSLEEKMKKFYLDKDYVISLSEKSRYMITSRYERSLIWNAILQEYKQLERKDV